MKRRNPSVSPVLIVGGLAGVAAIVWWATRSTAAATTQAVVGGAQSLLQATPTLAYTGDVHGRALTPAEIAAISANPALPLTAAETALMLQQRAAAAASQGRID